MKYVVYKIFSCNDNVNEFYIGSTTLFSSRKSHHRKTCNNRSNKAYHRPLYRYIRENGGFENFDFMVLETIEVENRSEGLKREQYWIDLLKPTLNIKSSINNF